MRRLTCLVGLFAASLAFAEDATTSSPRPIPLTRPEMKQYLEDMKARTPRIPLPELTDDEKAKLDERSQSYESRVRALYLPVGDSRGGFSRSGNNAGGTAGTRSGFGRENEPGMTLDYKFKVSLFWIVSRTNNCQYCLGHQESKLLGAGMTEDQIAALDADWSQFTAAEQAAFAYGRKLTLQPHLLEDGDIASLKKHFTDLQILEMTLSMAGNNSINRWKEGVGVPQSKNGGGFRRAEESSEPEHQTYLTPTSDKFKNVLTLVAPLAKDASGKITKTTVFTRPPLESREEVEQALATCRKRTARLPLVDEEMAREVLGEDAPAGQLPQWMRLLANFPQSGKRNVSGIRRADEQGDLTPLLKAQLSWIIARQDRAWYALGLAQQRLKQLGQSDDQIYALDGKSEQFTPTERFLFTVARKLAASPVVLTDDDVALAVKLAGPRDVVQVISYTTNRASFNRITEAASLQLE